MRSFLEEVVDDIWKSNKRLDTLIMIVPSKRAGLFLLQYIAKTTKDTLFAPKIFTIEEFVEYLSGLKYASQTQLLFELYTVYRNTSSNNEDSFYSFSKWATTLLQDFNEIDRYLISSGKIFSYLSAIQETTHWSLQPEKTPLIKDYLKFWNTLEELYNKFQEHLLDQGYGYQGLVYRQACNTLETYLDKNKDQWHLFIGFNALNAAESKIIQALLSNNMGDIYWDIDPYFLKDTIHDAGYFIRSYKRNWRYYSNNKLKGLADTFLTKKDIEVIGVPKNVSQAKYVGTLLRDIQINKGSSLSQTAVVLGNESLLNPILNSIPAEISNINITMGYPLEKTPMAGIFYELMQLHLTRESRGWFYKDILAFLSHPYINTLLNTQEEQTNSVSNTIREKNWIYLTPSRLQQLPSLDSRIISYLFPETSVTPKILLQTFLQLIANLNDVFKEKEDRLVTEYLARFHALFLQLHEFLLKYDFISDLQSLQSIYKELIASETLDFYGEPLDGIQIMGMLESRNLDFETVIVTSVNEGILPAGKSNNSFIPFDLKSEFRLPTYKEKDAVYTYHFYRLLQRAKKVYLLYNTQPDVLEGGEKSRFISQLLTDENIQAAISQVVASPSNPGKDISIETICKDPDILKKFEVKAQEGFSPTSLTSYIRNPIEFYKKVILKIKESVHVEETIAANTFGTIIHNTMEDLYHPFIGKL
ncbi:MAG: PD-(D/E)XK nuclease family protein, partial [Eudoraea sp.]|nr:PD-(D/E)XK nuclease family protein [Eudoraea sp.]